MSIFKPFHLILNLIMKYLMFFKQLPYWINVFGVVLLAFFIIPLLYGEGRTAAIVGLGLCIFGFGFAFGAFMQI